MDPTSNCADTTTDTDPGSPHTRNANENSVVSNLSQSVHNATENSGSVSGQKRPRYAQSHGTRVFNCPGPFLEFQEFPPPTLVPVITGNVLDLDERFFPSGIGPGEIVEVKGPENSGKTFLLTYFLAQLLLRYPSKTAVLIDTSHQFNLRNLMSIIAHGDKEIELNTKDASLTLSEILEANPKLNEYLDRLFVVKCYSAEEFILTVGPKQNSVIQRMIRSDPNFSLIAIDTVDNYSFAEGFSSDDTKNRPNILDFITKAVARSKTPVICTTIMKLQYHIRKPVDVEAANADEEALELKSKKTEESNVWYSNILMESRYFSHSLSISPASKAEKDQISRALEYKNAHYATAYLRSKHRANMAGSANHRVKFSIFSDMLWVDVSGDAPKK